LDKYEYKKAMNKIRWANRQKGEKWGKKEMTIAHDMVTHTPKAEGSGKSIRRDASQPTNLQSVLGSILKGMK